MPIISSSGFCKNRRYERRQNRKVRLECMTLINTSKIHYRKLLLCAIGMSDTVQARDIFDSMSTCNKEEVLTQFLMYKVALRSQDDKSGVLLSIL